MSLYLQYITFVLVLVISGCEATGLPNPEVAIQKELKKRINNHLLFKDEDCKSAAILDAEIYVDSIIYEFTGINALEDSIEMISKPSSPFRPSYLEVEEKGPIKPYIIDSTQSIN